MTKLFDDEEDDPNLIYQCHKLISESNDVIHSIVDHAPPTPIKVTRKQILKPESQQIDELGYLSQYILEMAQQEQEVKEDKTLELAQQEVPSHDDVTCNNTERKPLSVCELSVPDFSPDDSLSSCWRKMRRR